MWLRGRRLLRCYLLRRELRDGGRCPGAGRPLKWEELNIIRIWGKEGYYFI